MGARKIVYVCMNQGVQGKCMTNKAGQLLFLGGTPTHDTPLTTQSALPTELPGLYVYNTTQHKAKSNPNTPCYGNMSEQTGVIKPPKTPNSKLWYLHESRGCRSASAAVFYSAYAIPSISSSGVLHSV